MPEYSIREYIPQEKSKDMKALLSAYLEIWNKPKTLKYLSYTGLAFEKKTVREWFSNHLDEGVHYYAAVDSDRQILGICVVRLDRVSGFDLGGLGVRKIARSSGIGRSLVKHALHKAVEEGFTAVDVRVYADNTPMLRLLLGMGFIPVRMQHNIRWDGGDLIHLRKILS